MHRSFLHNTIYFLKERIVIIQPPLCIAQMHIDCVCRNQTGHRFTPFGYKYMLLSIGHLPQNFREVLFGLGDINSLINHSHTSVLSFVVMMTQRLKKVKE